MVDFQNLRRGSICQQQGYQGTGKTEQQTRGKPGARKMRKELEERSVSQAEERVV